MLNRSNKVLSLIWLISLFLLVYTPAAFSRTSPCNQYTQTVRKHHFYYFGLDFPYWYSVGQIEHESNCRNVLSKDGIGSEGLPQITYRWWASYLKKEGIYDLKTIDNQLKSHAFINFYNYKNMKDKKLFKLYIMYQLYNRGPNQIYKENKEQSWDKGYQNCLKLHKQNICVWKLPDGSCKQYRTNCDINYKYSKEIYNLSQKYKFMDNNTSFLFY